MGDDVPLRVLYAASECAPWVKTGGLGDVTAALPPALAALGVDVRVCLPAYRSVREAVSDAPAKATLFGALVRETELPSGVRAYLIDAPWLFDREGGPYQDTEGRDWADNAERFALFSQVAAVLAGSESPLSWRPHIFHGHDWQAALAPVWLRLSDTTPAATIMTVHNLAFQGLFPADCIQQIHLPPAAYAVEGAEFYGQLSFLKGGLHYADALTTVSPTYAKEIQTEAYGCGLQGLFARRQGDLTGIINGIDEAVWNPETDPLIGAHYDAKHLSGKPQNKAALQRRFSLPERPDVPVFGVVGRLTQQKGVDLIVAVAERLVSSPAQLIILGCGEHVLEAAVRDLVHRYPSAIAAHVGFDERLAHEIEAGADLFLMPSRFEPCGLNQMYSQRYGTPPIARATGGLVDTIRDGHETVIDKTTGFLFHDATPAAFWEAITRALAWYRSPSAWEKIVRNAMRQDFGWSQSAKRYLGLYKGLLRARRGR
ncbi:MAG TPA: glycogen synthase GlgA [Acidiferrobacter sp.]|nr:glycogen synthase GlgA [Acidiferrobacter sp.]